MASIERYSSTLDGDPYSALLFANPDSSGPRERMSIRVSLDEGQTWPYKKKIDDLPAAYSCMTILDNGDIGIFYETGDTWPYATMTFARFPIEWVVGTTDTDTDGVSDFEEDVLGLDKTDITDGAKDSDGDGKSDFDEYQALTDWNNGSDYLKLEDIVVNGSTTEVTVETKLGRVYELQSSTTLEANSWTNVSNAEAGTGGDIQFNYPASDPVDQKLFFRIKVSQP